MKPPRRSPPDSPSRPVRVSVSNVPPDQVSVPEAGPGQPTRSPGSPEQRPTIWRLWPGLVLAAVGVLAVEPVFAAR